MTHRIVEPEWLDELPSEDPNAVASRRDLRRLNWFMNHAAIVSAALRSLPRPRRVIDLGAGDGTFALRLASAARWQDMEVVLVDRSAAVAPALRDEFRALDCHLTTVQCDVLEGLDDVGTTDGIITNLFLHHFDKEKLPRLLHDAARCCQWFIACEPRRSAMALMASRLVGLIGCNAVTRHDAVASVRAGFRESEISDQWPRETEWSCEERGAGLFSHLFLARRL